MQNSYLKNLTKEGGCPFSGNSDNQLVPNEVRNLIFDVKYKGWGTKK